jgi:hypothetical protein
MGNSVVMGRRVAVIPNPAEIIYFQELNFRSRVAFLRPSCDRPGRRSWHVITCPTCDADSMGYPSLYSTGGNLLFANGHAKWRKALALRRGDFGVVPPNDAPADSTNGKTDKLYQKAF